VSPVRATHRPTGNPLTTLGIVVGLKAEARIARRLDAPVAIGGGTQAGARTAAQSLLSQGATALLSFGLAGGLDPSLPAGTIIIPSAVVSETGRYSTAPPLAAALGGPTPHLLLASDHPITTPQGKQHLFVVTGCAAVDMESGAVGEVAANAAIPFAVLRAICDPAERTLPPAALIALDARGVIGLRRIAISVLRDPTQLPSLLALARDANRARRALAVHLSRLRERSPRASAPGEGQPGAAP
jgi:adenosylhomocysteine nucleosidase